MEPLLENIHHRRRSYFWLKIIGLVSILILSLILFLHSINEFAPPDEPESESSSIENYEEMQELFSEWMRKYNKTYPDHETQDIKFWTFVDNYNLILNSNLNTSRTYKLGLNKFADLNTEEFTQICCGYASENTNFVGTTSFNLNAQQLNQGLGWSIPMWRYSQYKDGTVCKASWAGAVVAAVEAAYMVNYRHKQYELSIQQVIDCASEEDGCYQGDFLDAYKYIQKNGLVLAKDYPYTGVKNTCHSKNNLEKFKISGWKQVIPNDQDQLVMAIYKSPVVVTVQANQPSWQFYQSGVINDDCGQENNHVGLIYGHVAGGTNDKAYRHWLIKHFWGEDVGANGFVKVLMDDTNVCGVMSTPSYPVLYG